MGPVTYMATTGTAILTAQSETSETAQSTVGEHLAVGVPATIGYFLAGALVLVVGFIVLDLITPGKLRDLVFLENRAGAAMIAGSQQIALACIVVSVIRASDDALMIGLGGDPRLRCPRHCAAGSIAAGAGSPDSGALP